ncbi:hypothetical protein Tco_0821303 [Tanacetum coccineum]|uniref:Uncharacterized protein n=1 Tax=Tanacetum coccineum TaxID=301880 RepID=A0ABQ5AG69_9ASTR
MFLYEMYRGWMCFVREMLSGLHDIAYDNDTYSALLKTLQCSFVSLTSSLQVYHQGTISLQKCFSEYQGIRHDQRLKMLLVQSQNPLDTRVPCYGNPLDWSTGSPLKSTSSLGFVANGVPME